MPKEIDRRVERALSEKVFPGCVIGTIHANGSREIKAFGHHTYASDSQRVEEDTIYDLASVTKSIPVASLALTFVAEGRLQLTDTVVKYLPELHNDYGATIEDLLRYRVQGPRLSRLIYPTFEQIRTHILEHGFNGPPGERLYTNVPAYILGLVLERVGESTLPALAHRYFFEPLNMHDTTFFPSFAKASEGEPHSNRVAPTEVVEGKEIRGIVHDESARAFSRTRRAVGHAGLFSTAPDILNFFEALLIGKFPAIVEGAQRGMGWQLNQPWFMGAKSGEHTFGKTGFTGTSVLCDMGRGTAFVILSNRTYPVRPADAASIHSAINVFRSEIADILLSARG